MREIKLDYGKSGLTIQLEEADVFYPASQTPLNDAGEAVRKSLLAPDFGASLRELVKGKSTVAIAHTDITRATPNHIIIPVLIAALLECGIKKQNITLINMTGSHRAQTQAELETMLTKEVASQYKCVQHNSFDYSTMSRVGLMQDNNPLYINSVFYNADFKICTGFIEPHFFAGFSGGPKAILPGLADIESIMRNHCAERIAHPLSSWGITEGNPVWENIREGASLCPPDFLINVALNNDGKICAAFSGEWDKAHKKGCEFVKRHAMIPVQKRYDTVITTNSGYPLDINLYQCVKGMSAAAQIVKENGTIIIAGECRDGIPEGSPYHNLLKSADSPEQVLEKILSSPKTLPEQWQTQIQAAIQKKARVYLYSGLKDEQVRETLITPCKDISSLVKELGGSVAVLPKGPQTIPYIID
ncbi:MAG: nickel-dependent lactate racemase [Christensenellales bacterium]|jgi:nickel-dependent lactate racemase